MIQRIKAALGLFENMSKLNLVYLIENVLTTNFNSWKIISSTEP